MFFIIQKTKNYKVDLKIFFEIVEEKLVINNYEICVNISITCTPKEKDVFIKSILQKSGYRYVVENDEYKQHLPSDIVRDIKVNTKSQSLRLAQDLIDDKLGQLQPTDLLTKRVVNFTYLHANLPVNLEQMWYSGFSIQSVGIAVGCKKIAKENKSNIMVFYGVESEYGGKLWNKPKYFYNAVALDLHLGVEETEGKALSVVEQIKLQLSGNRDVLLFFKNKLKLSKLFDNKTPENIRTFCNMITKGEEFTAKRFCKEANDSYIRFLEYMPKTEESTHSTRVITIPDKEGWEEVTRNKHKGKYKPPL